ncbi:lysophospholipid transporter [Gammaproteobacteria bacterium]|nr:lysophospholipid transporter [Gammaproteobacteria bacterium]
MNQKTMPLQKNILNKPMYAIGLAQFFSALADNTLLFALLKILKSSFDSSNVPLYPNWSDSALQASFIITYILLAPIVGTIADHFPKGQVMMSGNALKLLGVFGVFFGLNPFVCYSIVGLGAAIYSPAKFGILGEIVESKLLVKANGFIEGSTIAAILLGSFLGGFIADKSIYGAIIMTLVIYILAVISNIFIPKLKCAKKAETFSPKILFKQFFVTFAVLFKNKDIRFGIIGTSLFWGAATTLRLLLIVWVPIALLGHATGIGIQESSDLSIPSMLNGLVGIGVVFGAALAGFIITLENARKCLIAGFIMGVLVLILGFQNNMLISIAFLLGIGFCGGFFIVPLNAVVQMRGKELAGVGSAIAVQNFCENIMMILMLSLFALARSAGIPIVGIIAIFGIVFSISILLLGLLNKSSK